VIHKLVDIVVGGQFGAEAKGKTSAYLASRYPYSALVRVGAPNSGHSVQVDNKRYKLCQLPCAALTNHTAFICIGAGALIDERILKVELDMIPNATTRLVIDRNAGIITEKHRLLENHRRQFEALRYPFNEGVGDAQAEKVLRNEGFLRAEDIGWLRPYIANVSDFLNELVDKGKSVLIEGNQGFGISLNHGYWPHVTSRDVLASSLLSDCGLSPLVVRDIYLVVRTYPVRVAGNTGSMGATELTWGDIVKRSGAPLAEFREVTRGTNTPRRISEFNWEILEKAVRANRPTQIVVTFADYLDWKNRYSTKYADLTSRAKAFIERVEEKTHTPVKFISVGQRESDMMEHIDNKEVTTENQHG